MQLAPAHKQIITDLENYPPEKFFFFQALIVGLDKILACSDGKESLVIRVHAAISFDFRALPQILSE